LVGSTIESPAFSPHYTAEKNLELQRVLVGNPDRNMVGKVLRLVGLSDCQNKKAMDFSMGMKQRLGIALSLIGNPQMLILDEPVNGLDPKGIAELRTLLKKLNEEQNITILISSHILSELYLLATDFIIIHKGKIIDILTHEELNIKCQKYITIRMSDVHTGIAVLEKELQTSHFEVAEDGMVCLYDYTDVIAVAEALRKHNILVTHIALAEQTLEDYYLSITRGQSCNVN
jgi:ABC-2 type transport system ATP-binding protein